MNALFAALSIAETMGALPAAPAPRAMKHASNLLRR
jgi:hypothetical protein